MKIYIVCKLCIYKYIIYCQTWVSGILMGADFFVPLIEGIVESTRNFQEIFSNLTLQKCSKKYFF